MQAEDEAGHNVLPRSRKTRAVSRKTRAVLAVLALAAPKPVLRTRLTRLLWSGRAIEQGRGSLRQSVYELQQALGVEAASLSCEQPVITSCCSMIACGSTLAYLHPPPQDSLLI